MNKQGITMAMALSAIFGLDTGNIGYSHGMPRNKKERVKRRNDIPQHIQEKLIKKAQEKRERIPRHWQDLRS